MEKFKPHTYEYESHAYRKDVRREYKAAPQEEHSTLEKKSIDAVRGIVEDINQVILLDIFREFYGKVGNDINSLHISDIQDIRYIYDEDANSSMGSYSPDYGIVLNAAKLQCKSSEEVINTLIHEYLHEVSVLPIQQVLYETGNDTHYEAENIIISGVEKEVVTTDVHKETSEQRNLTVNRYHDRINEGLTQIITDDISLEYKKRSGDWIVNQDTLVRSEQFEISDNAYPEEQFNAYIYMVFVSVLTDVPEHLVKNACARTYFRNGKIVPEDLGILLHELGPEMENIMLEPEIITQIFRNRIDKNDFVHFLSARIQDIVPDKYSKFKSRVNILYQQLEDIYDTHGIK